jgi:hypothetical protein
MTAGPPPGIYQDPTDPARQRYWDGTSWGQQLPAPGEIVDSVASAEDLSTADGLHASHVAPPQDRPGFLAAIEGRIESRQDDSHGSWKVLILLSAALSWAVASWSTETWDLYGGDSNEPVWLLEDLFGILFGMSHWDARFASALLLLIGCLLLMYRVRFSFGRAGIVLTLIALIMYATVQTGLQYYAPWLEEIQDPTPYLGCGPLSVSYSLWQAITPGFNDPNLSGVLLDGCPRRVGLLWLFRAHAAAGLTLILLSLRQGPPRDTAHA